MIKFVVVLFSIALAMAGATVALVSVGMLQAIPSFFYETLFFTSFSTGVITAYLHKVTKPELFVQLYLFTMAVKLLGFGAYVLVMILYDHPGAMVNAVFFIVAYLVFSAVEIGFLYRKIARQDKP